MRHLHALPGPETRFDAHAAWRLRQMRQALGYLHAHLGDQAAIHRAAVILRAEPWHPLARRVFGSVAATYEGQQVTCSACKREYTCTPEDPYLDAATPDTGICTTCLFLPAPLPPAAPPAPKAAARRKVIPGKAERVTS